MGKRQYQTSCHRIATARTTHSPLSSVNELTIEGNHHRALLHKSSDILSPYASRPPARARIDGRAFRQQILIDGHSYNLGRFGGIGRVQGWCRLAQLIKKTFRATYSLALNTLPSRSTEYL
jgi:hypothetical protein